LTIANLIKGLTVGETILTWNVTNWITVVLMAMLGFFIIAVGAQLFH